ncbi:hypothetical protein KAS56_03605 [candidate division WOR-3 bacterium]|nr:hypothetical protein [candidate division WOR-3 bacterium]NOR16926.1 hypothetical protein [candidate division WOR-3 bacterium]
MNALEKWLFKQEDIRHLYLEISDEAGVTARKIITLKEYLITKLYENSISSIYAVKLIDLLFKIPIIDVRNITKKLKVSKDTGSQLVNKFEKIGILKELTGKQRYKKYLFTDYVNIIAEGTK